MRKRLLLLTYILLHCLAAQAQTFEPGLLVRSNGDTLRGEVENSFWTEPPTYIRFRATPQGPSELFRPRQLRTVSFTGGRYFRYEALPLDHAAETRLDRLPKGFYPDVRLDSVLAEVLLEGPVRLLRVVTISTTHYFLDRPGQPVLDLSERKYLSIDSQGKLVIVEGNNYRSQLGLLFGDCPAALTVVDSAPFTAEGLAAVAQAYSAECAPERQPSRSWLSQSTLRRRVAFRGGLLGGVRYNRIESVYGRTDGSCSDCKPRPFGGLYAELFQPGRIAAVYGELSLSPFQSRGSQYTQFTPAGLGYTPFTYRALLGTARLGIRFVFPLAHSEQQWLIGFGYELNKVFSPEVSASTPLLVAPDTRELKFGATTLLPNISLGWRAQRLTATLDGQLYASSTGSDSYIIQAFVGNNYVARLGLAYRLGRNPDKTFRAK
ncbi:hypothetical protein [Hymenobacter cellulosivorans]|uniref:Outer membrane protein beta-barrel domain-containing protein n=1 Tax=Hymenobacter cellulosivorans TaxID=2932249 RepID=A0ABY4F5Q1_9BACT|nr:hypothetical protein [Hymenobacter cellulosivorans]UOQ51999.1 hypothetical protein MUN80_19825 [Hymenobacter cellulosivorans]